MKYFIYNFPSQETVWDQSLIWVICPVSNCRYLSFSKLHISDSFFIGDLKMFWRQSRVSYISNRSKYNFFLYFANSADFLLVVFVKPNFRGGIQGGRRRRRRRRRVWHKEHKSCNRNPSNVIFAGHPWAPSSPLFAWQFSSSQWSIKARRLLRIFLPSERWARPGATL